MVLWNTLLCYGKYVSMRGRSYTTSLLNGLQCADIFDGVRVCVLELAQDLVLVYKQCRCF